MVLKPTAILTLLFFPLFPFVAGSVAAWCPIEILRIFEPTRAEDKKLSVHQIENLKEYPGTFEPLF
jgi:hypothetical protein